GLISPARGVACNRIPPESASGFARAAAAGGVCTCGGAMRETDTALVLRARDGDRAAFEELVRRTSRLVFARLYLDTGSVHRAEDLLQEALLLAFPSLPKLTAPA